MLEAHPRQPPPPLFTAAAPARPLEHRVEPAVPLGGGLQRGLSDGWLECLLAPRARLMA
jgi:hypothetical protein